MRLRATHRLAAIGLTTTLLLAGCSASDEPEIQEAPLAAEDTADDAAPEEEADSEELAEEDRDAEQETAEAETPQVSSGMAMALTSVPDVEWATIEDSPAHVLKAPGTQLRVTQSALLEELPVEVTEQLSPVLAGSPALPADGEVFLLATMLVEDLRWDGAEADSTGTVRVGGNPVSVLDFVTGSGERMQTTFLVSVPEDTTAQEAVIVLSTDDMEQSLSLIDGSRVASDVEPIYQAGTEVSVDGEGWSHEFEKWAGGTHEINGEVTAAAISPYVDGWARPGQVFLGVDIDARDNGGTDEDHTTLQIELPDGSTVTPDNKHASLTNQFAERAWFQVPADSTELTLHVHPKGTGAEEYEFDPVEIMLTITGGEATGEGATD